MSNTKSGGKKVASTNKKKYGKDYYKKIGRLGGKVKTKKGFAVTPLRKIARDPVTEGMKYEI